MILAIKRRILVLAAVFLVLCNFKVWAETSVKGTVENVYDDKITIVVGGVEYALPEGYVDDYYIEAGDEVILSLGEDDIVYDISFVRVEVEEESDIED